MFNRNTKAWVMQVWASFALSLLAAAAGIWQLSGEGLSSVNFAGAFLFCLFTTFTIAKTLRDNQVAQVDTNAWVFMVWAGFIASALVMLLQLWNTKLTAWQWGYLVVVWLWLVSSAFTLAKTLRDEQDAEKLAPQQSLAEPQSYA